MKAEALNALRRAVDAETALPETALEALSQEERALCLIALSTLLPSSSFANDIAFEALDDRCCQCLAPTLFELWTERLLRAGRSDLVFRLSTKRVIPASSLLAAAQAQIALGQFDLALRLARAISKLDKIPRSGGLIQIAHATGNAALFDEALAAIFDGEPITMGTGRGYDELAAGVRTIDALSVLPEAHPVLKSCGLTSYAWVNKGSGKASPPRLQRH